MEKLAVVSPLGLPVVKSGGSAPRLDTLACKTIGEVWNGVFKGDFTFPIVRKLLTERCPDLKIIPYTEGGHTYPTTREIKLLSDGNNLSN